jgi:seryl-tRNA synthetase
MAYSKAFLLRDITTYEDDELVALVDGIRERRLRVATAIEKAKKSTDHARREKLEEKLVKRYDQFVKKLEKINTALTDVEEKLAEILAIRLQLGEDITNDIPNGESGAGDTRLESLVGINPST